MDVDNSYAVEGIESPVEILVDRWGVPHLYASSTDDAFFAQGFNAARERLWQIDLWRRRGLGPIRLPRRNLLLEKLLATGSQKVPTLDFRVLIFL
ncbi:hypothetical protein BH24ACT22_BH24ACT22_10780 [soil metagenome]